MWENMAKTLEGGIAGLEPLALCHGEGLYGAARDVGGRRWMMRDASMSRRTFRGCLEDAPATSKRKKTFVAGRGQKEVTV